MRRYATLLLALMLIGGSTASTSAAEMTPSMHAAIGQVAAAASDFIAANDPEAEFEYIFSAGGTPLTNGVFFPGTTFCDSSGCTEVTPVPQIKKGTDITFVNIDEGTVSNAHRIVCKKRNKRGRPVCFSDQLDSPGEQSTIKTKRLKPGKYGYFCSIHAGMEGTFEIIK